MADYYYWNSRRYNHTNFNTLKIIMKKYIVVIYNGQIISVMEKFDTSLSIGESDFLTGTKADLILMLTAIGIEDQSALDEYN